MSALKPFLIILSLLVLLFIILFGLGDALIPLVLAFGLAYLFFPLIKKLEKKGISRNKSVIGVFSFLTIILCLVVIVVIPNLISDVRDFAKELPQIVSKVAERVEKVSATLGYDLELSKESIKEYLKDNISELSGSVLKSITKTMKGAFSGIVAWLIAFLNIFLVPLFFYYLVNDFEKVLENIQAFIPKTILPKLLHYLELANEVLSGYIRGQMVVASILACLYAVGLAVIGLKFGLLIGLISGLISIIPYAGFTLGFFTATFVCLANYTGPGQLIGVIVVFSIVQTLESTFITPKFVGDKVGLSSLATMLALIIGGNLFGMVGMLIAIPVAAIMKSIFSDLKSEYQKLGFYN